MAKIVPNLWFDKKAKEAVEYYISIFDESGIFSEAVIEGTPSGDSELISFMLAGQQFSAINGGPFFTFNPSISMMVACFSAEEVDKKWKALSRGGVELMPLGEYPFSRRYGWIQDRYNLSWQLMLTDSGQPVQKITPNLLFSSNVCGKAEEAIKYYTQIFENSETGVISRYRKGEAQVLNAKVNYAGCKLGGYSFSAMDNGYDVDYNFNEALSFIIECSDQKEIDYYWDKLSAVPKAEQCGWLKDQFGVSWQVVPTDLDEFLLSEDKEEVRRVTKALLKMKKIDISKLEKARGK